MPRPESNTMNYLIRIIGAALFAIFLTSCTFQSDTVLWAETINSDEVEGVSLSGPTTLEVFDIKTAQWQEWITLIPYRDNDGLSFLVQKKGVSVRETEQSAAEGTEYVVLFFRKLGPSRYIVRYSQVRGSQLKDTGLAFVSASGNRFYLLTSVKNADLRNEIVTGSADLSNVAKDILSGGDGGDASDANRITTMQQAEQISKIFHEQRARFGGEKGFAQVRVAR